MAETINNKTALVLSGGGIKASAFHLGVCIALKEKGYTFVGGDRFKTRFGFAPQNEKQFRMYIGSSAGAFVSSLLANGYSPESIINAFNKGTGYSKIITDNKSLQALPQIKYRNLFRPNTWGVLTSLPQVVKSERPAFGSLEAFLKNNLKLNGFFTTQALEEYLKYQALEIDEFHDLGVELYIIATQLNHTRKAIFGHFSESSKTRQSKYINYANISQAVAASVALPPFFAPKKIKRPSDGKEISYFDGEIRDTLSSHLAEDFGATHVVASYSVHPYHYTSKIGSLDDFGLPVIINQALYQVIQQKIEKAIYNKKQLKVLHDSILKQISLIPLPANELKELQYKITSIFKAEAGYRPETKWTYIHPGPEDDEMFFADHFSLNNKTLERIVGIGYRSAILSTI